MGSGWPLADVTMAMRTGHYLLVDLKKMKKDDSAELNSAIARSDSPLAPFCFSYYYSKGASGKIELGVRQPTGKTWTVIQGRVKLTQQFSFFHKIYKNEWTLITLFVVFQSILMRTSTGHP